MEAYDSLVLIASNKPNKMLYSSYITNICKYKEISPFIPYFMYKQIIYKSFVFLKYSRIGMLQTDRVPFYFIYNTKLLMSQWNLLFVLKSFDKLLK